MVVSRRQVYKLFFSSFCLTVVLIFSTILGDFLNDLKKLEVKK